MAEPLPALVRDSRLTVEQGLYQLVVSTPADTHHPVTQWRVVALNPGVRSFLTYLSETDRGHIGLGNIGRIQHLCQHLDDLQSRARRCPSRQRRHLQQAAARIQRKVRPLIDKLHYQAARWLAVRYDTVLLPVFFATSDMVICGGRKIRSKTVHHILTFALFRFRQFLRWETWQYGKVVLNVNKSYASRTCSWSGEIIDSFGGRRTQTGSDGVYLDREINGARGISLLALGGTPYLCENVACLARMYRKWPYGELESGQERCSEFE